MTTEIDTRSAEDGQIEGECRRLMGYAITVAPVLSKAAEPFGWPMRRRACRR